MVRVSLIVPAYNEEKYISSCLESLKNQTYKDFEIIVVNNNSTDNTAKIAKKYTIKVFLEKNKGYHYAANRGVKESRGKYITFCDADCIYPKDWLQKVMNEFDKFQDIIAVYGTAKFYDYNTLINPISEIVSTLTLKIGKLMGSNPTMGFNFVIKKEAYLRAGGYNPKIYNEIGLDLELGKRLTKIGPVKQNSGIVVYTSSRRFKKDGIIRTCWYTWGSWYRVRFGKSQKISYEEYNKK
jgi:glycosyltransferase involved in cell wall biosynthesis